MSGVKQPTSFSLAYQVLLKEQNESDKRLKIDKAFKQFRVTPGLTFSPGTTSNDILLMLENYNLIKVDWVRREIFVLEGGQREAAPR